MALLSSALKRSLGMGIVCGVVGAAIVALVLASPHAADDLWADYFFLFAGIGAFITATLLWQCFIERKSSLNLPRAICVGCLSGFLSHYLCWYLLLLSANMSYWIFGYPVSSLGEAPIDPITALWGGLVYCLWSWLLVGWITVPVGGVIGGCYLWFLTRRNL